MIIDHSVLTYFVQCLVWTIICICVMCTVAPPNFVTGTVYEFVHTVNLFELFHLE